VAVTGGAVEADHFVVKIGNGDIGAAGVVEVSGIHAHTGAGLAIGAEGDAGLDGDILERAVAIVAVKLVGLRVIGDQKIGPAVVIVVEHGHAQRLGTAFENSAIGGDVFEGSIAAVVEQPASLAAVGFGRTVRFVLAVEATEDVMLGRPLHVVADEE